MGAVVRAAVGGVGGARWVLGEPGIGKSAFLDAVAAGADPGVRVLRCSGLEAESELAWSALGELLGPLLDDGFAAGLPAARRSALLGALALDHHDGPIEPYAVLTGALGVLRAATEERPVVVLVDDAHWLDEPSRLAVEFLANRCEDAAMAIVAAARPDHDRAPAVPVVALGPLDHDDADALLADLGVRSPSVRERLVDELSGNPMLLREAVEALDADVLAGGHPLPEALPVPASVLRLAEQRLAASSPGARAALLVAATSPERDLATIRRALDLAGVPADGLDEAERDRLVDVELGEVRFGHPTLRTAVLATAEPADRRAAHAAVAEALSAPAVRCWHRALSLSSPDEAVAAELEAQAGELADQAAWMTAARHLELAARISPEPSAAGRRLRRAAEAAAEQGRDDVAEALLVRAEAAGGDPQEAWHRRRLRLGMALRTGDATAAVDGLRALAAEIASTQPALAAEVLLDTLPPLVQAVRVADVQAVAEEAARLAVDDPRLSLRADVALGVARSAVGDADGPPRLARYREILEHEGARSAAPFLAEVVAPCLTFFEREPEVDELFAELERDLRAQAAAGVLVQVLSARAMAGHRRDLRRAQAFAAEAVDLADAIGRPGLATVARAELVSSSALIGDRERCVAAAAPLLASAEPAVRHLARHPLGVLHLAEGDLDGALAVYEEQRADGGLAVGMVRWEIDWCEALVQARRPDEAAAVLEEVVRTDVALLGAGGFTRVRGMLADDLDEAEELFASALRWFQLVGNRTGEGRTELVWGERLRRARRRGAAREHLQRAVERFDEVGAAIWARRARHELATAGGASPTSSEGVDGLTGQELAIARLAVAGASNQAIGSQVFLSPRTVETHLSAVFRKLGVRNRRELSALAVDEPKLRV